MHRIKVNISLFFLRLIACLPFSALYCISDILYFFMYHIKGYRKQVVRENLRNSFPEKDEKERLTIEKRFYRHLCDVIVETIKLLHVDDKQLHERIELRQTSVIEKLATDGGSIFLLLGHYCNWEWVQKITWHYHHPTLNYIIYRPVKNTIVDEIFLSIRSRFPTIPIPQDQAIRTLLADYKQGKQCVIAFISDQRPNNKNLNHWTTFLNQDTPYAVGAEEIGKHVRAHLLYLDVEKPCRGHYIITVREIPSLADEDEYPLSRAFLQMMEATIRRDPAYWLWTHKRWRIKRKEYKQYK